MRNLTTLILLLLIHFLAAGQIKEEFIADTIAEQSILEPVVDTIPSINIFEDDEPLNITLKYDITSFIRNKRKEEYLNAELQIQYSEAQLITKNIRLKARGNFRKGQCMFPPIFLNFKTDPFKNNDLEGVKKVKLVTHCSNSKKSENYILREYIAYKLYNILTENSFRVRLCNINYIDTGKKGRNYQRFGFLIEPEELLAKRNESILVDPLIIQKELVIEADADRVAFFQYMIGNTDWRIKYGHNMKYVKSMNMITRKVIPVPYDFDFSGLVNTYYSYPLPWTNSIDKVTEREYLGYCRNKIEYLKNIELFNSKKDDMFGLIENFKFLDEKEVRNISDYIQEFFTEISYTDRFTEMLKYNCRTDF